MFMQNQTAFSEYERVILAEETRSPDAFTKTGMVAGTQVETGAGWYPVEQLGVGDRVQTLDGGAARIVGMTRSFLAPRSLGQPSAGLMKVPGGVLSNCDDLLLPEQQMVMIESAEAEKLLGEPSVLIPAAALEGYRGIQRVFPDNRIEIINLAFADEEIVFANTGALIHCGSGKEGDFFTRLEFDRARALLSLMDRDLEFLTGTYNCTYEAAVAA